MKKNTFFILILILFSCTKEIDLKEKYIEKRLVLNALICPDSLITVNVRKTTDILSQENTIVENAKVSLLKNGKFAEILLHTTAGNYKSQNNYPQPDSIYTVKVEVNGYPTIKASDTIPQKTPIIYGSLFRVSGHDENDSYTDFSIKLLDYEAKNFFEIAFVSQYTLRDSMFNNDNFVLPYYSIDYTVSPKVADPVIKAESELDLLPFTYLFSDDFFNGTTYNLKMKFKPYGVGAKLQSPLVPTDNDRYVVLRTTSSVYFNYKKYWLRHSRNQQIGSVVENPIFSAFVGDPVPMYSNVEGGYGIFAAYNQTNYILTDISN